MDQDAVARFAGRVHAAWGPVSSELVATCREALAALTLADPAEAWVAALHAERPETRELVRDAEHGFMLLAHTESEGLYRPPHDHGRAWVVYAVLSGALEIGTYGRASGADGAVRLVRRDSSALRPGEARAYLEGDIHDTCCRSETSIVLRFTERDLRHEDRVEGKVTRYVRQGGDWVPPA